MSSSPQTINRPMPSLDNLQRLAISESGFVFDPESGHSFTANETGLVILRMLQKNSEIDSILAKLEKEYDVSLSDAKKVVLEFAGVLRELIGD